MTAPEKPVPMLDGEPIRPLTTAEYLALAEKGFFEDERVELLFGAVVPVAPADFKHTLAIGRIVKALIVSLQGRALVLTQGPFDAADGCMPEPDVFVVPTDPGWSGAQPDRAALVIEVSRSSLRKDRVLKAQMYAQAKVDEYWIVNHIDGVIEVYRDARSDGTWKTLSVSQRGETVSPLAFPDVTIAVDDVVPPPGS